MVAIPKFSKVPLTAIMTVLFAVFVATVVVDWSDTIHAVSFFVSTSAYAVMIYNFISFIEKMAKGEIDGLNFPGL